MGQEMTLEELYFLAGIVTGFGVIGSLLFVGLQMREQNRDNRLQAYHNFATQLRQLSTTMAKDEGLSRLWLESTNNGLDDLKTVEQQRLSFFVQAFMRTFEDAFFQYREGRLREREWESIERSLTTWKSSNLFRSYWANRSFMYSDEFVTYMNCLKGADSLRSIAAKPEEDSPSNGPTHDT